MSSAADLAARTVFALRSAMLTSCAIKHTVVSDPIASCGLRLSQTCYNLQLCGQLRHSRHTHFMLALFRLCEMFFRDRRI